MRHIIADIILVIPFFLAIYYVIMWEIANKEFKDKLFRKGP